MIIMWNTTLRATIKAKTIDLENEIALRKEAEFHFRNLFENMTTGVAVYNPINNGEDFIFVDINAAGQEYTSTNHCHKY